MARTITLRVDEHTYDLIRKAAGTEPLRPNGPRGLRGLRRRGTPRATRHRERYGAADGNAEDRRQLLLRGPESWAPRGDGLRALELVCPLREERIRDLRSCGVDSGAHRASDGSGFYCLGCPLPRVQPPGCGVRRLHRSHSRGRAPGDSLRLYGNRPSESGGCPLFSFHEGKLEQPRELRGRVTGGAARRLQRAPHPGCRSSRCFSSPSSLSTLELRDSSWRSA